MHGQVEAVEEWCQSLVHSQVEEWCQSLVHAPSSDTSGGGGGVVSELGACTKWRRWSGVRAGAHHWRSGVRAPELGAWPSAGSGGVVSELGDMAKWRRSTPWCTWPSAGKEW